MQVIPQKADEFFQFMIKRECLRIKKEKGMSPPWTGDPILRKYRFTNVRRHHDRTSKSLIDNFYRKHHGESMEEILLNCTMFRYFGWADFVIKLGWQKFDEFQNNKDTIIDIAERCREQGEKVFTTAYVISNGGKKCSKVDYVVEYVLGDLHDNAKKICDVARQTRTWEHTCKELQNSQGMGGKGFMSKEVLLDTTYTGFWNNFGKNELSPHWNPDAHSFPEDWDSWTPVGPGGERGIARVFGFDDVKNLPAITAKQRLAGIMELVDLQDDLYWYRSGFRGKDGSGDWLSPTDIQFQLCEFDKYERCRLGQGAPRAKYQPTDPELALA